MSDILSKVMNSKVGRLAYDRGPTLMVVGGVVMLAGAGVHAVVKTPKFTRFVDREHDERQRYIALDDREAVSMSRKAVAKEAIRTYGPDVALAAAGAAAVLAGHGIIDDRLAKTVVAYKALDEAYRDLSEAYEDYRRRNGDESLGYEEVAEEEAVEGEAEPAEPRELKGISPYSRIFDEANINWTTSAFMNKNFLIQKQAELDNLLQARGYLFLNEVYEALGFKKTYEGRNVGWSLRLSPGKHVDFGLYEFDKVEKRMFMNCMEACVLLNFNVDGWIADELPHDALFLPGRNNVLSREID
ncbi:MAG: hypothetical protein J6S63_06745 [Atopobiaceae bacterium]|nr:hypothetical protein [Atopobiaceae bacterium]